MMLAVRVAGKLQRGAEAEIRFPRIAERPAAIVALEIDEHFWFVVSVRNGHDLAHACRSTAASWCDRWELDDVPAEGGITGTPAAGHTPEKRRGNGWDRFASACPAHVTCAQVAFPRRD